MMRAGWLFLASVFGGAAPTLAGRADCPRRCRCAEDGALLRLDCSDLGLVALPANLSLFASYLDLSMNSLTLLPAGALSHLRFLEELRLAGNGLSHIPAAAFSGLVSLKVLMLQNNRLRQVPSESLQPLRNLQSLRLDANLIVSVPPSSFNGPLSLRHLWLDDNALTEVPVPALAGLSSLQAMTLALNRISHIPDGAFINLTSLVVLHLHNNRIHTLGNKCFDGLQNLETLDLNYNSLVDFPVAVKALTNLKELAFDSNNIRSIPEQAFIGNPSLLTIYFYNNPIQSVGKSSFQLLPELRTLSLNGATEITEFPDLTGTMSLESLTITGARISSLPSTLCNQLPKLKVLDLSYNLIQRLPSFSGCENIQKITFHHNEVQEVLAETFQGLPALRSVDLAWNRVGVVEPHAFSNLPLLARLDLTSNLLSSLPAVGLQSLTHLKLAGNGRMKELLSAGDFPAIRVLEMPYTFQCCAFMRCETLPEPWAIEESSGIKEPHGRRSGELMPRPEEHDLEDFPLEPDEDPKFHQLVQCSPAPGRLWPCSHLFRSWGIRAGVWVIVLLSLICNILVACTVFLSPALITPSKHLMGFLAVTDSVMGLSSGFQAVADVLTVSSFAAYAAWWETGTECKVTGFLSLFAGETRIFLLTTAMVEYGLSIRCSRWSGAPLSPSGMKAISGLCFGLALSITVPPILYMSEHTLSSLCLPLPFGETSSMGFMVALVLLNLLCYFVMTVIYTMLYCSLEKNELDSFWDCSMIKHLARLLFTNCLLYIPVAFVCFTSLLSLSFVNQVVKSMLLVIVPLPACLNPLLYIFFNPHFKEDLGLLCKQARLLRGHHQASLVSLNSEDTEKQSCDSMQALMTSTSLKVSQEKAGLYRNPVPFAPCS